MASREEGTLEKVSVINSRGQVKLDAEKGEAQRLGTGACQMEPTRDLVKWCSREMVVGSDSSVEME